MTEKSATMNATSATESAPVTSDGKPLTPLMPDVSLSDKPAAATPDGHFAEVSEKKKDEKKDAANEAMAPPPTKEEARTFAREFLVGELIKAVKSQFVPLTKPFIQLSEFDQTSLLKRVQFAIEGAVKEAIEIVASDGRLTFRSEVESVTFKDGVKVVMKLAKSEHAHTLADQSGKSVLVVVEDFVRYMNAGDETKGEPDQKPLFDKSKEPTREEGAAMAPKRPPKKIRKAGGKPLMKPTQRKAKKK